MESKVICLNNLTIIFLCLPLFDQLFFRQFVFQIIETIVYNIGNLKSGPVDKFLFLAYAGYISHSFMPLSGQEAAPARCRKLPSSSRTRQTLDMDVLLVSAFSPFMWYKPI